MSAVLALTMQSELLSEIGVRRSNEDAVFASPRLAAVADGVSGAVGGGIASRLAIDKLVALDKRRLSHPLVRELVDAVADANAVIAFATFHDPRLEGMATTLTTVALSDEGEYLVANVGDSRIYLLRNGCLRRLTRDDSLVQAMIEHGALTEDEARHHPQRSVVLEVLDGVERQLPALKAVQAQAGDRLFLCSDGITDYLSDAEVAELLNVMDAAASLRGLVNAALGHGSRDNLTGVVADVITSESPCDGWLDALPA